MRPSLALCLPVCLCPCLCLSRRPAMGWGRRGGQRWGGIGGARCGYTCKSKLISHLSDSDRSEILLHITTDDKIACKDLLVHPLSRLAPSCTSFLSLYISVSLSLSLSRLLPPKLLSSTSSLPKHHRKHTYTQQLHFRFTSCP